MPIKSKNPKNQKRLVSQKKLVEYEKMLSLMRSKNGFGEIKGLAKSLRVSSQTVRRNMDFLEKHQNEIDVFNISERLIKIPAGSFMLQRTDKNVTVIESKDQIYNDGINTFIEKVILKNKIINENQLIIMDASDLCLRIAEQLPADIGVTILTNAPSVAAALKNHANVRVKVIGGLLLDGSLIPHGNETYDELKRTYADLCILSNCKIQAGKGIAVANEGLARLKRAMADCSRLIAVLGVKEHTESFEPNIIVKMERLNYLYIEGAFSEDELNSFKVGSVDVIHSSNTHITK